MAGMEQAVRALFDAYAGLITRALEGEQADAAAFQALYADYCVGSAPAGVIGSDNASLAPIFPAMIERYRSIGGTAFEVAALRVSPIDDIHACAEIDWSFAYAKDGEARAIPFTNHYYVTLASGEPKVFAFITPDEEKAMREAGLA